MSQTGRPRVIDVGHGDRGVCDADGLDRLYVDVEVKGAKEQRVVKRAPEATVVPKNLDGEIAKTLSWLEEQS